MICSGCGKQIIPGEKFCSGCGAAIVAHAIPVKKPNRVPYIILAAFLLFIVAIAAIANFTDSKGSVAPPTVTAKTDDLFAAKNEAVILMYKRGEIADAATFQRYCGKADSVDTNSPVNTLLTYNSRKIPGSDLEGALQVSFIHQVIVDRDTNPHFGGHSRKIVFLLGSSTITPDEAIHILGCETPK